MRLYSYRICPYCAKVKAVARMRGVPFESVEVNPLTKAQIAFSDYKKVPIAVFDDRRVVVDSERIIDELLEGEAVDPTARRWSRWASDELALMMYPNLTRSFRECREALAYADDAFPFAEALAVKWVGALGMSLAHGKIKRKYNIEDERAALGDRLTVWEDAIGDSTFHSRTDTPDLADVSVYGVLGALEGTSAYKDVMARHPKIRRWATRVEASIVEC